MKRVIIHFLCTVLEPRILLVSGLLLIILTLPYALYADEGIHYLYGCPEGYPESPAFTQHVEQTDLVRGVIPFTKTLEIGELLFVTDFNACDGQGRPATTGGGNKRDPVNQPAFIRTSAPDAHSCSGCHNEPRIGGGGDFVANVFVLAQTLDPVTESVNGEFSNERNTVGMFGAGPVEMLAREMTADLYAIRDTALTKAELTQDAVTMSLDTKGVHFGTITALADGTIDSSGVRGVDPDLIVRPFHQAGKVVSLREFTNNAMNHHHGMQAEERFDLNPQKGEDFDEDGIARELTVGDVTAVTLWQAALATPGQLLPETIAERDQVNLGETLFASVGCTNCHIPELILNDRHFVEPNPYNPDDNLHDERQSVQFDMTVEGLDQRLERHGDGAIVRLYSDLKRHNLCDPIDHPDPIRFLCNEQLAQNRPDEDGRPGSEFFLTRKLWDVGNSGPYGHRGDLTTLTQAILVHGGEARSSRDAFVELPTEDKAAIVTFLKTLQVLPPGTENIMVAGDESVAKLASSASPPQPAPSVTWADMIMLTLVAMTAAVLIPFTLKSSNR